MKYPDALFLDGKRRCNRCGDVKPLEEYHRASNSSGRQYHCKACGCQSAQASYRADPARKRRIVRDRYEKIRAFVDAQKIGRPCTDCGRQDLPPYCLDFDHLGDKEFGIAVMRQRGMSMKKIAAEIAKCDLVCAVCHRIRTHDRLVAARTV